MIVNLIKKFGVSDSISSEVLKGCNSIVPTLNFNTNVDIKTLTSTGTIKVLDWHIVSQDRIVKPIGNVVSRIEIDSELGYLAGHLKFTGSIDVPYYDIDKCDTVVNDMLGSAILCLAKQDLPMCNLYMKSFFMVKSLYTQRAIEFTQIKSIPVKGNNYF